MRTTDTIGCLLSSRVVFLVLRNAGLTPRATRLRPPGLGGLSGEAPRRAIAAWALTCALVAAAVPLATPAQAQTEPCRPDRALSRAAAQLLAAEAAPTRSSLAAALDAEASSAVAVQALYLPQLHERAGPSSNADGGRVAQWLARRLARSTGPLMCGHAQGEHGELHVVASDAGQLRIVGRKPLLVRVRVAPGFTRPELVVAYADGELARFALPEDAPTGNITLPLERAAPHTVQLLAWGQEGPVPIAQRSLVRPSSQGRTSRLGPASVESEGFSPVPSSRADGSLAWSVAGELNALRRAHGVAPVRRHRRLRDVAKRHAHRVCMSGRVAHVVTHVGEGQGADPAAAAAGPEQRIERAGLHVQRVGEAIARVGAPDEAFAALARSPSHLRTLTLRRFSDAGVGVARGPRGRVCVVVLLALWPRYLGAGEGL